MCAQTVILTNALFSSDVIDDDLFAANALLTSNYLDEGGAYDRMLEQLDWSGLRFPGGMVNEAAFAPGADFVERFFDVTVPSGLADDGSDRIVTAPAMFDYAGRNDLTFHFTLPTKQYLADEIDEDGNRVPSLFGEYRLLDRTDEIIRGVYGEINIESFEIGNEFWGAFERISPEEYGLLVNNLATGLQALFDVYQMEQGGTDAWQQPLIAAQVAPGWLHGANDEIADQLSLDARSAIDAVITHYYPTSYLSAGNRQSHFDHLDEWQNLEGVDQELEYFVSEWNMQNGSETGLVQASGVLETFTTMLERGVDYAAIWGTQYYFLGSRLAVLEDDPDAPGGRDYTLTATGELYRMMSEDLRGLRLLDLDTPAGLRNAINVPQDERDPQDAEQLVMHAFANADTTIVFLSSRSEIPIEVTVDPGSLVGDYHHVWAEVLGVIDDPTTSRDEGDPFSRLAEPYIETFHQSQLSGPDGLTLTLDPYEIVQLEFTTGDIGVEMSGHDYVVDPEADYDDNLTGTMFDDTISGHSGADTLRGNGGDDILSGGAGDDFLGGWMGDDLLDGGAGDDTLIGGEGNDTLIARGGTNDLRGTEGVDQFIVDPTGQTRIFDFDIDAGEGLSFLDIYDLPDEVTERTRTDGDDLVIGHDDGGETRLVGLGGRAEDLGAALSDFQPDADVAPLVEALTTPPPDGSIAPDPDPEPQPETPPEITREELNDFLQLDDPQEVAEFIGSLTPEEEASLLDQVNVNALALTQTIGLWGAVVNNLSDEGYERVIDEVDPEILDLRIARITAETYANRDEVTTVAPDDPIGRSLLDTGEEVRIDLFLALSDSNLELLEELYAASNPDQPPLDAQQILQLDPDDIEARRQELLTSDEIPEFARFLKPGAYNKDYLTRDEDDDDDLPVPPLPPDEDDEPPLPPEDDDPVTGGGGGGGCFVATCAYGDYDHPDVVFLRLYRDLELAANRPGRAFIRVYYIVGPWLAAAITPFPLLRAWTRRALARCVASMQRRRMVRAGSNKCKPMM